MPIDTARYLERLGLHTAPPTGLEGLRILHEAHMRSVPFENLDIRAGVPIVLDLDRLFDKVITRRRGGFCYELNGLFAALLTQLGFRVELLSGQVWHGRQRIFGEPYDHMALRVRLPEGDHLADVGFGDLFLHPLPMLLDVDLRDGPRNYHLVRDVDGHLVLRRWNGRDHGPIYKFSEAPCELRAFEPMCAWHQTSPTSHFTQRTICTKALPDGRITVTDKRLIMTRNGVREERSLDRPGFHEAMRTYFGMGEVWTSLPLDHGA